MATTFKPGDRHKELVQEMLRRGFKPAYTACLAETWGHIPKSYWKGYKAPQNALELNQDRIARRLRGNKAQ